MATALPPTPPAAIEVEPSVWTPFRHPLYRAIWGASLVSFVGSWMHEIGAAWLMTSLAPSPLMVSLVQTAGTAPMLLLALPAGAIADVVDRRRLLLGTQLWMVAAAATLGFLTTGGHTTAGVLLAMTFALGVGNALNGPAWQALTPDLVPRAELPAAVSLGAISVNLARAVGPALGGFVVGRWGPGGAFFVNAASFLAVIVVLASWRRTPRASLVPAERVAGAMRAAVRYVQNAPELSAVLVRTGLFVACASATWGLMPLVARQKLHLDAHGFGLLLGALGLGAVAGAAALPTVRTRLSAEGRIALGTLAFASSAVALGMLRQPVLVGCAMAVAGGGWLTAMATFNVLTQTSVPGWIRARAMALYMLVFQGGLAIGAAMWGAIAERIGLDTTLLVAAAGLLAGVVLGRPFRVADRRAEALEPSRLYPAPTPAAPLDSDRGPVLVTIEYRIDPARADAFRAAAEDMGAIRRRDGAYAWGLFGDVADPSRQMEAFVVESWVEHVRQHDRMTFADREVQARMRVFHLPSDPPVVHHLVSGFPTGDRDELAANGGAGGTSER
ncbi:MAG: MFS transporter [bacterium]